MYVCVSWVYMWCVHMCMWVCMPLRALQKAMKDTEYPVLTISILSLTRQCLLQNLELCWQPVSPSDLSLLPTQLGSRYIVATSGFLCGGQWFKVRAKCLCCECPSPSSHLHKPLGNYFYLSLLSPVMSLYHPHVVLDSRDGMRAWSHGWLHICSLVCNVASVTRQWFRVFPVVSWRGRKTQCAFSPGLEMVTQNDDLGVASQSIGRAMKEERAGPD